MGAYAIMDCDSDVLQRGELVLLTLLRPPTRTRRRHAALCSSSQATRPYPLHPP